MKNGKRTKIKTYAKSEEEANAFKDSFNIVKSATLPTELCQQKSKNVEQEQNITTNNANNLMLVANKKNKVTFAELTQGKRIERHLKEKVKIKDTSEFKLINKPLTR